MTTTLTAIKPRRRVRHRHPAEVTSDRLGDHFERYYEKFDQRELDYISLIRQALEEIAEGVR